MVTLNRAWGVFVSGVVVACTLAAVEASAQKAGAPAKGSGVITLIGRGHEAEIIDKNGAAHPVEKKDLVFLNIGAGAARSGKAPAQQPAETVEGGEVPGQEGQETADAASAPSEADNPKGEKQAEPPPARGKAAKKPPAENADHADKKGDEKAFAEEVKKADIERLRRFQGRGAWFYDKDNQPLSAEELNKRIEAGDVGGIKATDVYFQEYETQSKPAEGDAEK